MTSHLALVGPTATGKSAVALAASRCLGDVEIVSVDSMQVYRGMDIGTAKPTPAEQAEVPHHLIDVADAAEDYSVARFAASARGAIADIEDRGLRALLVGGTGLYYQALIDGLDPPGEDRSLREALDARGESPDGLADLYGELQVLDPVAAGRIEPRNRRRIVRALEVTLGTGRPFSSFGPGMFSGGPPALRLRVAGLWMPRALSARRIEERFRAMADNGLVDEVEALAGGPRGLSRTARQAIGYKEVLEHLDGRASLEAALGRAVDRTRQLARRQRMWFRRDPRIAWIGTGDNPLASVGALLALWKAS